MKKIFFSLILSFLLLNSCSINRKIVKNEDEIIITDTVFLGEIEVTPPKPKIFQLPKPIINELVHTKLNLNFDFKNKYVFGEATITLSPFINSTDSLVLDAKYFDIQTVALINLSDTIDLNYDYNNFLLKIKLDKIYTDSDEYKVFVKYTAKPEDIPNTGNRVYTDTKGIYFINTDKKDKKKPQQIWTQGETEYNSCWFPTIDSPNQRCTGEIFLTVPAKFVTLSNGELYNSLLNLDTSRTDHWKMDLPIAPYLFMIAVGDFEIVNDEWRQIEVNYYMPVGYEDEAEAIFGKTPEMLEFYSTIFGYEFPWNKYSQIIVNDFVSGAMENATATVFGSFMLGNSWWYTSLDKELIIAHELSHHWFGDLVTCESWANTALNESFATYAEYLWLENEYGVEDADYQLYSEESYYIQNTEDPIIDYYFTNKDDMFSPLAYQKGGKVLHTLRNYVGDDNFFSALKIYLKKYEYNVVNINDLKQIFEQVTGEDLTWFFDQWFMKAGYPEIEIFHNKIDSLNKYQLTINQEDVSNENKIFILPVDVAVYFKDTIIIERINFNQKTQIFDFSYTECPLYVEFDPYHSLICQRYEDISDSENLFLVKNAKNALTKFESIYRLTSQISDENQLKSILFDYLNSESWLVRIYCIENYDFKGWKTDEIFINKLKDISKNDKNESVRKTADIKLIRAEE